MWSQAKENGPRRRCPAAQSHDPDLPRIGRFPLESFAAAYADTIQTAHADMAAAAMTAWVRFLTPSDLKMAVTWIFTVPSDRPSS